MESWYQACKKRIAGQDDLLYKLINDIHDITTRGEQNKLIILTGPPGSGKTFISSIIAEESSKSHITFYCHEFYSREIGESARIVKKLFNNNEIIILENIECILLGNTTVDSESLYDNQQEILQEFSMNYSKIKGKYFIAITNYPILLNFKWMDDFSSPFQRENISISIGNDKQKEEILLFLSRDFSFSFQNYKETIKILSKKCHGYTAKDLVTLTRELISFHYLNSEKLIDKDVIDKILFDSKPFILRNISSINKSIFEDKKTIKELVGHDDQIHMLLEKLKKPCEFPELNLLYPRGIVIWGPSGCGKSHLVSALCQESGINHIIVEASNIRSKYMGASEKNLAEIFKKARDCSPCILVFEHFETLIPNRSFSLSNQGNHNRNWEEGQKESQSSGTDERLLAVFLCEVDGMETDSSKPIVVIATANRIDNLDPSVIRKSRLEIHVEMKKLDNVGRDQFLTMKMANMPINLDEMERNWLIQVTEGWSGANLEGLFNEAALLTIRQNREIISKVEFESTLENSFLFKKLNEKIKIENDENKRELLEND